MVRRPRIAALLTLAMINVAAVMSVRNWPTIAEYGVASLFFFALAALLFLVPVSMVAAFPLFAQADEFVGIVVMFWRDPAEG